MIALPVCKTEYGRGIIDFSTRSVIENISDESIVQMYEYGRDNAIALTQPPIKEHKYNDMSDSGADKATGELLRRAAYVNTVKNKSPESIIVKSTIGTLAIKLPLDVALISE